MGITNCSPQIISRAKAFCSVKQVCLPRYLKSQRFKSEYLATERIYFQLHVIINVFLIESKSPSGPMPSSHLKVHMAKDQLYQLI